MDKLFAVLLHAAAQLMGYQDAPLPVVFTTTHESMQAFMCGQVAGPCAVPTAVYFAHRIIYDQTVNLQDEYGKAIIVHEMVHYLQDLHGWGETDCWNKNAREAQAYLIQYRYLESRAMVTDLNTVMSGWNPPVCPYKEVQK
jgi:hypothetical protein